MGIFCLNFEKGNYAMIEAKDMGKYLRSGSEAWYPIEITEALLRSSMDLTDTEFKSLRSALEDAIYQLMAMAQNEYNQDYWRVLWNVLQNLMEKGVLES